MDFKSRIDYLITAPDCRHHQIEDGTHHFCYQDLPQLWQYLDTKFSDLSFNQQTCFSFECDNSVSSALTLLYLLYHGHGFVLLPPSGDLKKEPDFKPSIPQFCQYHLDTDKTAFSGNFLAITENAKWQQGQHALTNFSKKLYLRTSGSMGNAKVVVHAHQHLYGNVNNCIQRFQLVASDRVLIPIPIFHMYGLGAGFLPTVMAGANCSLQQNTNILTYIGRERQFKPNCIFITPTLVDMLVKIRRDARTYKLVVTAGDRINPDIFQSFVDKYGSLVNLYGSSEMGAIATSVRDKPLLKLMPQVQMHLQDKIKDKGKLLCQHPFGFERYINEFGEPLSTSIDVNQYDTGDLGQLYENDYINVLGRSGNSINRNGFLVLFSDIETKMETLTAVNKVVVIASQQQTKIGQQLTAFCILPAKSDEEAGSIREQCFTCLPKYAIPDKITVLKNFPTLPNGKIDRQHLIKIATNA